MGGGPGAALPVGGQRLVFEPEAIEAIVAQFEGIVDRLGMVQQLSVEQLAGRPAALDFAPDSAAENVQSSATSLQGRMREASIQIDAAIANLRANGSDYTGIDAIPGSAG